MSPSFSLQAYVGSQCVIHLGLFHLWVDPTVSSPKVAAVQAFFTTASIIDHYLAPGLLESSLSLLVFKLL